MSSVHFIHTSSSNLLEWLVFLQYPSGERSKNKLEIKSLFDPQEIINFTLSRKYILKGSGKVVSQFAQQIINMFLRIKIPLRLTVDATKVNVYTWSLFDLVNFYFHVGGIEDKKTDKVLLQPQRVLNISKGKKKRVSIYQS